MGMGTLLESREVLVMATGKEKAAPVAKMLNGRVTSRYPASFLQLHTGVEVLLDAAAAQKLVQTRLAPDFR